MDHRLRSPDLSNKTETSVFPLKLKFKSRNNVLEIKVML